MKKEDNRKKKFLHSVYVNVSLLFVGHLFLGILSSAWF